MTLAEHTASAADCRREILRAKRHEGGLKMWPCLRVQPAWFAEIVADARGILARREASEVARPEHPTHWVRPYGAATQHSLYNYSGRTEDYSGDFTPPHGPKRFGDSESPAIERFVSAFEGHLINVRLNGLMPSSGLRPHEESILRDGDVALRFHLPVITNRGATLVLDGERFHFEPGVVYFFN